MKQEIIDQINALDAQGNQGLIDAVNNAKSLEEIIDLLNANGVKVTKADFTGELSSGELTEDALDEVAGGGGFNWGQFKSGYNDGYGGKNKTGNGLWYCIGYGIGAFLR